MQPPTERQRYLLANLERIKLRPYKLSVSSPSVRYQLDGQDCTQTITSLIVRGFVREESPGKLLRLEIPFDRTRDVIGAARAAHVAFPRTLD